ncbi:MAG TPA: serine protease [Solirubrobacteraceae bacterium]|nr:serine protease [Solirubrobacteraceae bacterium]
MRRPALLIALLALALPAQAGARVMNGADAAPGDYPWSVALVAASLPAVQGQFCGGALIAPDKVLTAAHCAMGSRASEIDVFAAADHDLADEQASDRYDVVSIHIPETAVVDPDSDAVPRRDMAVLDLDRDVADAEPIAPVAAEPGDTGWAAGDDVEVMGWGRWHQDGFPDVLQHATLDRVGDVDCSNVWGVDFSATDMICALRATGETVYDSCNGDSGGPLTTLGADAADPVDWRLVGVVSFGSGGCDRADQPGVYARAGAPVLNAFIADFRDGEDPDDPPAQVERAGGLASLTGSPKVGQQLTCGPGATTWTTTPTSFSPRIRYYDWFFEEYVTVAIGPAYTLQDIDEGLQFVCEVHARATGAGGYGVARSAPSAPVSAAATTTTPTTPAPASPAPTTPTAPAFPPPDAPLPLDPNLPPPPDPQPFVPEPRDETEPRTTQITKRCVRRRCTLMIRATDGGEAASGVRSVVATLTSSYRCVRGGRRRTCTRARELTATRVAAGVFRVRTGKLPRRARNVLRVLAVDAAGNEELRPRAYGFSA